MRGRANRKLSFSTAADLGQRRWLAMASGGREAMAERCHGREEYVAR
jgi:hypothetical protein